MRLFVGLLAAVTCLTSFVGRADDADVAASQPPIPAIDVKEELAVRGYDVVAYFTDGKPIPGSSAFEYRWQGARWRFSSASHLASFKEDPEHYAPQFGGYCSLAASLGRVADGDPTQWAIVDGHLFLNNNPRAQSMWDEDRPGRIVAGRKNWPLIPKLPVEH